MNEFMKHHNYIIIVEWTLKRIWVMHQSFVVPAPTGPWNSGAFNFLVFKALLNALHCGDKFMVKSLLKAHAPGGWLKRRTTNDMDHLNKLSSPIPWFLMKFGFNWPSSFREDISTHTHTHARTHQGAFCTRGGGGYSHIRTVRACAARKSPIRRS